LRRALHILSSYARSTGYEHPHFRAAVEQYRQLLRVMGKSQAQIDVTIEASVHSQD
jgi:hypothetical protein